MRSILSGFKRAVPIRKCVSISHKFCHVESTTLFIIFGMIKSHFAKWLSMRHANILDNSPGMAMIWSSERLTMGDVCVNAKLIRSPTLLIGTFVRSPKAAKNKSFEYWYKGLKECSRVVHHRKRYYVYNLRVSLGASTPPSVYSAYSLVDAVTHRPVRTIRLWGPSYQGLNVIGGIWGGFYMFPPK